MIENMTFRGELKKLERGAMLKKKNKNEETKEEGM